MNKTKCSILFIIIIILLLFYNYLSRSPDRHSNLPPNYIISPAEGRIMSVHKHDNGTNEVSIFLRLHDVHTQYMPIDGLIIDQVYKSGINIPAFIYGAVEKYNRTIITTIKSAVGEIIIRQIVGAIYKSVKSNVVIGQVYPRGYKMGKMLLGSRVDIIMPSDVNILVKKGQKVIAGITAIAIPNYITDT